jgi:hypothetical protein
LGTGFLMLGDDWRYDFTWNTRILGFIFFSDKLPIFTFSSEPINGGLG